MPYSIVMRRLIVNGDDFGFNREVTDGIIKCHCESILTSTTLMVNMPAAEYAAEQSKKYPNLSVGIHLNLTNNKPVANPQSVPTLVGQDGNFTDRQNVYRKANRFQFSSEEIEIEFRAQIEKFLSFGITPSHCDSHHRVGAWLQTFPIQIKVLKEYGIKKLRTHGGLYHFDKKCPRKFKVLLGALKKNTIKLPKNTYYKLQDIYSRFKGYSLPDERYGFAKLISSPPLKHDIAGWRRLIENMPHGTIEFNTHPGLPSADPHDTPEFRKVRSADYNFLMNPACKKICQEHEVKLINFNGL